MISKQNLNTIRLTKSLKIRDIKKILKQENKDLPFDGYATKYKNIKV